MGTVDETLGFEPEVLWMPELDELNSARGRIAIAHVARAELLSLAGYSSTVVEDPDQAFRGETQNIQAGIDATPLLRIAASAVATAALQSVIKKPVIFGYNSVTSAVDSCGKLFVSPSLGIATQAMVKNTARDLASSVVSKARTFMKDGYLSVYGRGLSAKKDQPAESEANPMTEVLERVVDVLEAVTQPRVTEIERDEAGLIASVTSR